ncbi:hypothetical protein ACFCYN_24165 [Gottfriedia sp. NPDC056225]|uniref:hypothetical protein n=1 Tax=Gottfriedia sp. NPDC056225 TaxID=3345751 RepID=UPI0035E3975B
MKKKIITLFILFFIILAGILSYQKIKSKRYNEKYNISLHAKNLSEIISNWNQNDDSFTVRAVQKISKTDTAIAFVNVNNIDEGFCKLEEGMNHKFQIKSCTYGSVEKNNWFRSRKIKTNKGNYGVFEGENAYGKIKSIIVSKKQFTSESNIQENENVKLIVPQKSFFYLFKKIEKNTPIKDYYNVAYLDQNGKSINYFIH